MLTLQFGVCENEITVLPSLPSTVCTY